MGLVAVGCGRCNGDIAKAEVEMPEMEGYMDPPLYIGAGSPTLLFDGVNQKNTEVIAAVPGEDGWLLRYHRDPNLGTKIKAHRCSCGRGETLQKELWRGKVEFVRDRNLSDTASKSGMESTTTL